MPDIIEMVLQVSNNYFDYPKVRTNYGKTIFLFNNNI